MSSKSISICWWKISCCCGRKIVIYFVHHSHDYSTSPASSVKINELKNSKNQLLIWLMSISLADTIEWEFFLYFCFLLFLFFCKNVLFPNERDRKKKIHFVWFAFALNQTRLLLVKAICNYKTSAYHRIVSVWVTRKIWK